MVDHLKQNIGRTTKPSREAGRRNFDSDSSGMGFRFHNLNPIYKSSVSIIHSHSLRNGRRPRRPLTLQLGS
ncbi:hypothetical protein CDL15_Pgr009360 [Punica granatum]|uniref:Uncharacterized protein n=1 Tax=Punica granatum TaxID=22663 RepID=A0A218XGQ5_PUNGR|nr:hypothetical protein CDL15_Pgr009360 [Punica granatum]